LQGEADADLYEGKQFETRTGTVQGYSNTAFPPISEGQVNLVNYYDDYAWGVPSGGEPYGMGFVTFGENTSQAPAKGLPTGTKARLLDGSGGMLLSVTYYDAKNRPVQLHQQTPFKAGTATGYPVTRTDLSLGFSGEVLQTAVYHRYADGKAPYKVVTQYQYDRMGRKVRTNHSVNDQDTLTLAEYGYDEIGRLAQKRLQPGEYRTIEAYAPTDQIIRDNP
jgi:hypothetical protein